MNQVSILTKRLKIFIAVFIVATLGLLSIATTNSKYFDIAKNIEIYANLYKEINTYYVDDVDPGKLMRTGVDAMLQSLDPYTNYISEAEVEGFRFMTTGKYGGIGAIIRKIGDYVVIVEPYENFPAHKAGLEAGDIILRVDGKDAKGKKTDDISNILKGSPGTEVSVEIKRAITDKIEVLKLKREEIKVPNVPFYSVLDNNIGYIKLTTFTQKAGQNVANAVKALKKENKNLNGLIFDLRGNGGGLLTEAINVSNVFVPKGKEVVSTKGKLKEWDRNFKTLNKPVDTSIPLTVLINSGSASASEIVSGVIQDFDRGVLIGAKSYGKGLVQNTKDVGYNSKVKLTTAKYYIPSGRCIQAVKYKNGQPVEIPDSLKATFTTDNGRTVFDGGGITPDIKLKEDKYANITIALLRKNLIFDYATIFKQQNKTIAAPNKFTMNDKDFEAFVQFISDKDYTYETNSEKALKALEEKAKKEQYLASVESNIEQMKTKIAQEKKQDLYKFKEQIINELETEIIARYYFQKGKIEVGLRNDIEIKEAISLLNNKHSYKKILNSK